MKYFIPGKPVPLQRPRFGMGRVFDNQQAIRRNHRIYIEQQHNDAPKMTGPLELIIKFVMPIGQGLSNKKKEERNGMPHTQRPDLSNLLKWYEDVMQSIIYDNDSFIVSIIAYKEFGHDPGTHIEIIPFKEPDGKKEERD